MCACNIDRQRNANGKQKRQAGADSTPFSARNLSYTKFFPPNTPGKDAVAEAQKTKSQHSAESVSEYIINISRSSDKILNCFDAERCAQCAKRNFPKSVEFVGKYQWQQKPKRHKKQYIERNLRTKDAGFFKHGGEQFRERAQI